MDQGRLNIGRHGLIMTLKNVLNENGVAYSMPAFRGNSGFGMGPTMQPPSEPVQRAVSLAASQAVSSPPPRSLTWVLGLSGTPFMQTGSCTREGGRERERARRRERVQCAWQGVLPQPMHKGCQHGCRRGAAALCDASGGSAGRALRQGSPVPPPLHSSGVTGPACAALNAWAQGCLQQAPRALTRNPKP